MNAFATEFAAFIGEFKAGMPKRAEPVPFDAPFDAQPFDVEAARAELATIRLDAHYDRSDDYTAYCRGRDAAARHAYLTRRIAEVTS